MTTQRKLYFSYPVVDFACAGGLSLMALGVGYLIFGRVLNTTMTLVSVYLSWVVNWPHFSATNHRLWRKRQNLFDYPLTSFLVPVLVTAAALLSFAQPQTVAPYFLKLFLLWSPYHFSGQTLGICLLYARRAGFTPDRWERAAISFFIFSTFLTGTLAAETAFESNSNFYEVALPSLHVPAWFTTFAWYLMYGSAATAVAAMIRRKVRGLLLPPLISAVPVFAQWGWFVVGWRVPTFYYFVPFFHSLQYLLVAWAMHVAQREAETGNATREFRWTQTGYWFGINVAGGALLFWALPELAASAGFGLPFATAVVISAVQIHHFIVDGVIWKLRNRSVAQALIPNALTARKKAA